MTVTYIGLCARTCADDDDCSACPASPVGTMTCDSGCGASFEGAAGEADWQFRQRSREAGWQFCRPTRYRQTDVCPDCPPHEHY